jgi:hypothetical protein
MQVLVSYCPWLKWRFQERFFFFLKLTDADGTKDSQRVALSAREGVMGWTLEFTPRKQSSKPPNVSKRSTTHSFSCLSPIPKKFLLH